MKFLPSVFLIAMFANAAVAQVSPGLQLSDAERMLVAVQKICPVTGKELGSMGDVIKVKVGEEIAFLCCDGCKREPFNAQHWQTIQSNMAKAQGICPVMKKPLPENAQSVVVNGRRIFVCCPGCNKMVAADPATYTAAVDERYVAFVQASATNGDEHLRIAAQNICPVSGQTLGSMGEPVKVTTNDHEELYLCCKGCLGKPINPIHWTTMLTNLQAAQGKCPVMGKQLPANPMSVVVHGRRVFLCCPGCDKKLAADPEPYLAKVDEMYAANVHPNGEGQHSEQGHDNLHRQLK